MKRIFWTSFWSLPALIISLIVILDQATKHLIVTSENLTYGGRIEIIPNFFYIVHVRNTGAAWGILSEHTTLLAIISAVVFAFMIKYYESLTSGFLERCYAITLMMGGIGGNLIDRVVHKSVVDFLSFSYKSLEWPSFNVADTTICIGVGIYSISSFLRPDPDNKNSEEKQTTETK